MVFTLEKGFFPFPGQRCSLESGLLSLDDGIALNGRIQLKKTIPTVK